MEPSPPGDTIRDIMEERGITRFKLGKMLAISDQNVLDLLDGKFPIDNDMACRLSEVLGSTPDFWENREKQYRDALSDYPQKPDEKKPQREYIITEDQMKRQTAWDITLPEMRKIHDEIRSRLHTSASHAPPEHNELAERECAINNCLRKDWMARHDAAIIAAAIEEDRRKRLTGTRRLRRRKPCKRRSRHDRRS